MAVMVVMPVRPRMVPVMMAVVRPGLMMPLRRRMTVGALRGRAATAAIGKRILAGQSQPGGQTQSNHPHFHDAPRDMTTRPYPGEGRAGVKALLHIVTFCP
jgi:hypothetical protein